MSVRVVATVPMTAGMIRVDELVAALARKKLWLTDAYYAGITSYVQALKAAAKDGVDIRLLVPGGSDIPILRPLSRAGYRPLLEAGARVFEWNGPMLHAKTAVAEWTVGPSGIVQPQCVELVRQLRAGPCRRRQAIRARDGGNVPSGFDKRDRNRIGYQEPSTRASRAGSSAAPVD
jgi:hypothetical protein